MALFGLFGDSKTVYFPGCFTSSFLPGKIENYRRILKKLDVDFSPVKEKDILCCGGFLDEAGYEKEFRKLARENSETFAKKGTLKIIASCPLCFDMLKQRYKEILPDWGLEVEHILIMIFNKLIENKDAVRVFSSEKIAYYDSCCLARYSGITEQPREILRMLGYKIIELPKDREETLCCGSCGGLPAANPELANKISEDFIKMLKRRGIKKLVTADSRAYYYLNKTLENLKIPKEELEVLEFSEVLCDSLGIKRS